MPTKTKTSSKRNAAARSSLARGSDSSPTLGQIVRVTSALGIKISLSLVPKTLVRPDDSMLLDYLAAHWDSQGKGHYLMGRHFKNPTGSFRHAVWQRMQTHPVHLNQ